MLFLEPKRRFAGQLGGIAGFLVGARAHQYAAITPVTVRGQLDIPGLPHLHDTHHTLQLLRNTQSARAEEGLLQLDAPEQDQLDRWYDGMFPRTDTARVAFRRGAGIVLKVMHDQHKHAHQVQRAVQREAEVAAEAEAILARTNMDVALAALLAQNGEMN